MDTFRIKAVPGEDSCTLILTGEADLAAVTFIDSTCIGAFIQLRNLTETANKQLVLANVPDRVQQILNITGLSTFLTTPGTRSTTPGSGPPPDPDSLDLEPESIPA